MTYARPPYQPWKAYGEQAAKLGLALYVHAPGGRSFSWKLGDNVPAGTTFDSAVAWVGEGRGAKALGCWLEGCRVGMVLRRRMARKDSNAAGLVRRES